MRMWAGLTIAPHDIWQGCVKQWEAWYWQKVNSDFHFIWHGLGRAQGVGAAFGQTMARPSVVCEWYFYIPMIFFIHDVLHLMPWIAHLHDAPTSNLQHPLTLHDWTWTTADMPFSLTVSTWNRQHKLNLSLDSVSIMHNFHPANPSLKPVAEQSPPKRTLAVCSWSKPGLTGHLPWPGPYPLALPGHLALPALAEHRALDFANAPSRWEGPCVL